MCMCMYVCVCVCVCEYATMHTFVCIPAHLHAVCGAVHCH